MDFGSRSGIGRLYLSAGRWARLAKDQERDANYLIFTIVAPSLGSLSWGSGTVFMKTWLRAQCMPEHICSALQGTHPGIDALRIGFVMPGIRSFWSVKSIMKGKSRNFAINGKKVVTSNHPNQPLNDKAAAVQLNRAQSR